MTTSIGERTPHEIIERLYAAAIAAVDPETAVRSALTWDGNLLGVGADEIRAERGVHLVAVGKAAVAMARGALAVIGDAVVSGDVITKEGHADRPLPPVLRVFEAGHPIPDRRGVEATTFALNALSSIAVGTIVLALISGGGSALLEAPQVGIELDDLALTTAALLRAGAPIDALNTVRAPLSRVKGGGLRRAAPHAKWVTLILSDVLGNDPRVIASGPTVAARRDPSAAIAVFERFGVREQIPARVVSALEQSVEDRAPSVEATDNEVIIVVADNATAVAAARDEARQLGISSETIWTAAEGEASELGLAWVKAIEDVSSSVDVLLGGGEATVTVRGNGRGGRNTEFALAAALELDRRDIEDWTIASLATDGQDALTGVAGAIADANTVRRAAELGLDSRAALTNNDSLTVFDVAGGSVTTGPTGTNVNDLYFAVRESSKQ